MYNFIAYNPVKLHFGKQVVRDLGAASAAIGKKALLVYGGGSVLRNGSHRDTLEQLESHGIQVTEFNGIKPNPRVEDVMEAARTGIRAEVDMVVAIGGGSVIDSAKIIAICIADSCDAWEVMSGKHEPKGAKPLVAVLTLAATGTEMNAVAVLQNEKTMEKIGYRNELIYPVHSFLDPTYTLSVPANYTAYGIVDLVAHSLEAWFGKGEASLSDRFVIGIIQEAMRFGPALMDDLENYELRARIMWAATNALNNTTIYGRASGDWGVHRAGDRISQLGLDLFGSGDVEGTISSLKAYFELLGSPTLCQDAGIESSSKQEILDLMNRNRSEGTHYKLSDQEREELLHFIF